jgi:hypothetical protein
MTDAAPTAGVPLLPEGRWEDLLDFLDPARPGKHGAVRDTEAQAGTWRSSAGLLLRGRAAGTPRTSRRVRSPCGREVRCARRLGPREPAALHLRRRSQRPPRVVARLPAREHEARVDAQGARPAGSAGRAVVEPEGRRAPLPGPVHGRAEPPRPAARPELLRRGGGGQDRVPPEAGAEPASPSTPEDRVHWIGPRCGSIVGCVQPRVAVVAGTLVKRSTHRPCRQRGECLRPSRKPGERPTMK